MKFADEQLRPLGDLRVAVGEEAAQRGDRLGAAQLLDRPQRVPPNLTVAVGAGRLRQQFDRVGLVAVGVLVERRIDIGVLAQPFVLVEIAVADGEQLRDGWLREKTRSGATGRDADRHLDPGAASQSRTHCDSAPG